MDHPSFDLLLPYQRRWIDDDAPIALGEKSRRIGWTFASACRAVYRRVARGSDLFHTSTDLTAAREFIEMCAKWARSMNALADDMGTQDIDERDGM
jgi:phage FluMu gp28-like protein